MTPTDARIHLFRAGSFPHVLVVDGSRIYEIDQETYRRLEAGELGLETSSYVTDEAPRTMPVRSLSLAIAQKCNLGCTYCYAQEGAFGAEPKSMTREVALRAVDLLFSEADPKEKLTLAFLGGEPLTNRPLLREAAETAAAMAAAQGIRIAFSITTNGTLITPEDGEFFERYGFAVTVSLDGVGQAHDLLRPFKDGRGSYERILRNVEPLLRMQRRMQVSARVTVTPSNPALRHTLDELLARGFSSVGFTPMLASPTGLGQMGAAELAAMLQEMIACGLECERRILAGERYGFSNLVTALRELHKGTHRPYPCGAAGSYFGVSADGELASCHRFVNDGAGKMGDVIQGVDRQAQRTWLEDRHVHRQSPCNECWARYLCGGGCHHEVIHRGRPACDYIRGWLHYSLQAYARLLKLRPDYFAQSN
ncbi:MAG: radical SAM protein [Bryobacteraceae bacterium]|nr:radical SAM protein [Bryobacteraceae bacterium]